MAPTTSKRAKSSSSSFKPEDWQAWSGEAFKRGFAFYIRVDVACTQFSEEEPHRLLDFIRSQLHNFCSDASRSGAFDLTLWPSLFVFSEEEAKLSASVQQDRGAFLIGVHPHTADFTLTSEVPLVNDLRSWERAIRTTPHFVDERTPPYLSTCIVERSKIGPEVVDQWIWPQPGREPLLFDPEFKNGVPSNDFITYVYIEHESASQGADTPQKFRPALDVISRLRHDQQLDAEDYNVIYEDRFSGYQEVPLAMWTTETTEQDFVPQHRITSIRQRSTGEIVWNRAKRIDKVFGR